MAKKIPLISYLMTLCLIAGLYSYWLPSIRVMISPIGTMAWSVSDVVKAIPKTITQRAQRPKTKSNFDFADLIMKIIPADSKTETPKKISFSFVSLALLPVAFALAYGGLLIQLILLLIGNKRWVQKISGLTVFTSLYALIGTYYLGFQAKIAFTNAVDKASHGTFGFVSKYLVGQIAVSADQGVYLLATASVLAFGISLLRKAR